MAGFKETPRQKMISMMYLVLTALLALNVSVEILNAFLVVNDSMEDTNVKFASKLDGTYTEFLSQYNNNPEKTQEYWDKAKQVKALAQNIKDSIEILKLEVIAKCEKKTIDEIRDIPLKDIKAKDKYDATTNFFLTSSEIPARMREEGRGYHLKNSIGYYRSQIMNLVDPKDRQFMTLGLQTDNELSYNAEGDLVVGTEIGYEDADGKSQDWAKHNFYHTILAADITLLNKQIAEVQNAEFTIVNYLFGKISKEDFKFSSVDAKVIPTSNYVLMGDNYEAEIIVAALDTIDNPTVYLSQGTKTWTEGNRANATTIVGENGSVSLKLPANSEGLKNYSGIITVKDPLTGMEKPYPFNAEYTVAKPSLTVSAMKMNVFYIGVDNPVSISVPGIPANGLNPSITKGTLKRDGGNWSVNMPAGSEGVTNINVAANVGGSMKSMGTAEFRVKRVPSPTATIAGVDGGMISKSRLMAATAIIPTMPADFDFELNFEITRFNMVITQGGDVFEEPANGNRLTASMKSKIKNLKRGQKIWFEDVYAKGPDGTTRRLGTISLKLN
ncbi:MAG: gliding motility protein GldM [Bacteroidales bacterium]|nr:gliding motility protein GldM [Bacteroidales bacterium]